MTFAERALYHQMHPAKLFADIASRHPRQPVRFTTTEI
jgi:hypothetical protein